MVNERIAPVALALTLTCAYGCRLLQRGPSDQEVIAAVEQRPPAPPTLGPTYLSEVTSVQVEQRGPYNSDGKYWPVRVRVKGRAKIRLTNAFQFGLVDGDAKKPAEPIEFVEDARLTKDDFGQWRTEYDYDPRGPIWRLTKATGPTLEAARWCVKCAVPARILRRCLPAAGGLRPPRKGRALFARFRARSRVGELVQLHPHSGVSLQIKGSRVGRAEKGDSR